MVRSLIWLSWVLFESAVCFRVVKKSAQSKDAPEDDGPGKRPLIIHRFTHSEEAPPGMAEQAWNLTINDASSPQTAELPSLGDFVALGDLVWTVIKDGKANNSVTTARASILEDGFPSWSSYTPCYDMTSNWFRLLQADDPVFGTMISVDARMHRCVAATLQGRSGRGGYIQNAWVELQTFVAFLHELKGGAVKAPPRNARSECCGYNPCAAIDMTYTFNYGSFIQQWQHSNTFKFTCDGSIQAL